ILGGAGADQLYGGNSSASAAVIGTDKDIILGDNGKVTDITSLDPVRIRRIETSDTLATTGGADTIEGNEDKDLIYGGVGADQIKGNDGNDVIFGDCGVANYNQGDNDLSTLDVISSSEHALGGIDNIEGNAGDDIILGGTAGDMLNGNTGTDILLGDNGEVDYIGGLISLIKTTDILEVTGGVDTIEGNEGDDIILGGIAGDTIYGNTGSDIILGDNGLIDYNVDNDLKSIDLIETEIVIAGLEKYALGGNDILNGNEGHDILLGGAGSDRIYGGNGFKDQRLVGNDSDFIAGDNGRISNVYSLTPLRLKKIETTDTVEATGGDDTIEGNEDDDVILGGVGNDTILGNDGNDYILGDCGIADFYQYDYDLKTIDIFFSKELALGGSDTIDGNYGNDKIIGGAGRDRLRGSEGDDLVTGDNGEVYFIDGVAVQLRTTDVVETTGNTDNIEGNEGSDILLGGIEADEIRGGAGDDIILGDNGLISYMMDGNIFTLDFIQTEILNEGTSPSALGGADIIFGNEGNDILIGGVAGDRLYSGNGPYVILDPGQQREILIGDNARLYEISRQISFIMKKIEIIDTVLITAGDDEIYGNELIDLIQGGLGKDLFYGSSGNGGVILTNYTKVINFLENGKIIETVKPGVLIAKIDNNTVVISINTKNADETKSNAPVVIMMVNTSNPTVTTIVLVVTEISAPASTEADPALPDSVPSEKDKANSLERPAVQEEVSITVTVASAVSHTNDKVVLIIIPNNFVVNPTGNQSGTGTTSIVLSSFGLSQVITFDFLNELNNSTTELVQNEILHQDNKESKEKKTEKYERIKVVSAVNLIIRKSVQETEKYAKREMFQITEIDGNQIALILNQDKITNPETVPYVLDASTGSTSTNSQNKEDEE
ncbi:MAG: hypothetical protein DKM50_00760, partial [Candidatus Margulisiibacteriota bacterium]